MRRSLPSQALSFLTWKGISSRFFESYQISNSKQIYSCIINSDQQSTIIVDLSFLSPKMRGVQYGEGVWVHIEAQQRERVPCDLAMCSQAAGEAGMARGIAAVQPALSPHMPKFSKIHPKNTVERASFIIKWPIQEKMPCPRPRCSTKFRPQQELGMVLSSKVGKGHETVQEANHLNSIYVYSDFGALGSLPKISYSQENMLFSSSVLHLIVQ